MHLGKNMFESKVRERDKLGFLEEKRDCCVNPSICSRSCKTGRRKRLGLQVQRNLR